MNEKDRWLLAIGVVVLDVVAIFVPVMALFAAYVLVARPPWFRAWIDELYGGGPASPKDNLAAPP